MNIIDQRSKIAEACGWTEVRLFFGILIGRPPNSESRFSAVPEYTNNLNAIAEARKVLNPHQRMDYLRHLGHPWGKTEEENYWKAWECADASAERCACAILKTLGLWEEESNDN